MPARKVTSLSTQFWHSQQRAAGGSRGSPGEAELEPGEEPALRPPGAAREVWPRAPTVDVAQPGKGTGREAQAQGHGFILRKEDGVWQASR